MVSRMYHLARSGGNNLQHFRALSQTTHPNVRRAETNLPSTSRMWSGGRAPAGMPYTMRAMFAAPGSPDRGSSLPVGSMSRLLTQIDNRSEADAIRKDREERQRLKAEADEARARAIAAHKQAEKERLDQAKAARAVMERQKRDAKRQQRELEAIWENERNERDRTYFEQSREKVVTPPPTHTPSLAPDAGKGIYNAGTLAGSISAGDQKPVRHVLQRERARAEGGRRMLAVERRNGSLTEVPSLVAEP